MGHPTNLGYAIGLTGVIFCVALEIYVQEVFVF